MPGEESPNQVFCHVMRCLYLITIFLLNCQLTYIGVHDISREIVALYKVMQIHNFFEPIVQGEESPNQVFCHVLLMMRCPYLIMLPWVL